MGITRRLSSFFRLSGADVGLLFLALFGRFCAEKSSLLIPLEVSVPLVSVVSTSIIFRGVVSAFFVVVIVGTSSINISLAALALVAVVSPESIFFRVLIVPWFYVSDRCSLPI